MRARVCLFGLCLLFAGLAVACGEPPTEIHESSVQLNTDDTKGPYEVMSVVTSGSPSIRVSLIYSIDGWKTKQSIDMNKIEAVGQDVYRGKIPGQPAGTTVQYYIQVVDQAEKVTTDPTQVPPQSKGLSYKFAVLGSP
jgi:hypothetical protein